MWTVCEAHNTTDISISTGSVTVTGGEPAISSYDRRSATTHNCDRCTLGVYISFSRLDGMMHYPRSCVTLLGCSNMSAVISVIFGFRKYIFTKHKGVYCLVWYIRDT